MNDLLEAMYAFGKMQARALRINAPNMSDTEVVDVEIFIPEWKPGVQIANAPVRRPEIDQVFRVITGHDSTANPHWTPETQPALFSPCHTKDPKKAKPWLSPNGTSGMYYKDECYKDAEGIVHQQTFDGANVYDAEAMPGRWRIVNVEGGE